MEEEEVEVNAEDIKFKIHEAGPDDPNREPVDITELLAQFSFEEIDSVDCFTFDSPVCYICNGYYGPCHGDPTCGTCHAFLFPNAGPDGQQYINVQQTADDSDSGNDEPVDTDQSFEKSRYTYGIDDRQMEDAKKQFADKSMRCKDKDDESTSDDALLSQESQTSIAALPPEVLMNIFEYLDELSLWSVGQVCERWQLILKNLVRPKHWKEFLYNRWPLLYVTYEDQDFYHTYTALIKSCSCLKCIKMMIAQVDFDVEDNSWRKHRLRTELRAMRLDPLEGIYALPLDPLCCHWQATIQGPVGSPYEGGLFFLYIQIPPTYPMLPPIVRFLTKILHPNVSKHGDIGIDSIHHNWSLALTISKVLISIQSLLTDPYCEICMEPAIGALYMENRPWFDEQARIWTWKYAMNGLRRY